MICPRPSYISGGSRGSLRTATILIEVDGDGGRASDGDGMKNDRPKENEKGKYKDSLNFPLEIIVEGKDVRQAGRSDVGGMVSRVVWTVRNGLTFLMGVILKRWNNLVGISYMGADGDLILFYEQV